MLKKTFRKAKDEPTVRRDPEVTGDMGTAVVAVETHSEDSTVEGEEIEYGYPITCGGSRAVLLFKKFVCPGINVRCVKYNEQLISPKQFVHLAGKATLKDWKRAIRLGGVMLRKMMDSGQIDFYQHDTVCTNTCRSTKYDVLVSSTRISPTADTLVTPHSPKANGGPAVMAEDQPEEPVAKAAEWNSSEVAAIATATEAEPKREMGEISEDTLSLWRGVADVGLMGQVVSSIRSELLALLRDIQRRCGMGALQEPDAAALNTLARMFGLLDSVKQALESRRSQRSQNQNEDLHRMQNNVDLEEEQKKLSDWPRRSQGLPSMHLTYLGDSTSPPAPKRPCLLLPASSSAVIGPAPPTRGSSLSLAKLHSSSTPHGLTTSVVQSFSHPTNSWLRTSCSGSTPGEEHTGTQATTTEISSIEEEEEEEEDED